MCAIIRNRNWDKHFTRMKFHRNSFCGEKLRESAKFLPQNSNVDRKMFYREFFLNHRLLPIKRSKGWDIYILNFSWDNSLSVHPSPSICSFLHPSVRSVIHPSSSIHLPVRPLKLVKHINNLKLLKLLKLLKPLKLLKY